MVAIGIIKKEPRTNIEKVLFFGLMLITLIFSACSKDQVIDTIDTIEEAIEEELKLDNLNGKWIRIASNNPGSDGMIVDMKGTLGQMTNKAGSGFEVGDIKWNNITAVDKEHFKHEELGSDYQYYAATMELRTDDTLRIAVGSSGAGNVQKWVRDGTYTPDPNGQANTETLDCNISEARTLTNGTATVDYLVTCIIDITAPLTIEPGVVIQFEEGTGLGVYDTGTIKAVGTATEPIVLRGTAENTGWWRGVHIETQSGENQLEHLRIEDAGSDYVYCCNEKASLLLKGAKISLNNVAIDNGGGIGLWANKGTEFDSYSNVTIKGHRDYPAWLAPTVLTNLDGLGSDYSNNDKNFIFVPGDNFNAPTIVKKLNVPYLFEGETYDVTEALTLEAGVEIVFQENGGIGVYDEGSLAINGKASDPVILRGQEALRGYWRGIHIETNQLENSLNYVKLSDAGSNYVYCCNEVASIYLKNGKSSITNSEITNGASYGITATVNFEFNEFQSNTITTHALAPMYLAPERMDELDGLSSTYKGNDNDYLLIFDGAIDKEVTVQPTDVPYQIETSEVIDIKARLNILAGVEMVFEENAGLGVYDSGILNVIGTTNERVIFRGLENIKGFWRGIHTETNSSSNVIRFAEIRNAGSNYVYCCNDKAALFIKDGQMTVENSLLSKSGGCGIKVHASANFMELNNDYSDNVEGDLCN